MMPKFTRGSTVFPSYEVRDTRTTVLADAALDGTVEFSIDEGANWLAGEWDGAAYMKYNKDDRATLPHRIARRSTTLAIDANTVSPLPIWAKVTDGGGEVFIFKGSATIA